MVTDLHELEKVDNADALEQYYQKVERIHQEEALDQQVKEEYKRSHGISTTFLMVSNKINNRVAKSSILKYLCRVFHI